MTTHRTVLATSPLRQWRTVDILTVTFLGAAFGVAFWAWAFAYTGLTTGVLVAYAPLAGLLIGPWFLAGVVGGLVVRRPGAALLCEVVAALVSMLPGTQWGVATLVAGVLQGLGVELAFAVFRYRRFGIGAAGLAGALAAPLEWAFEVVRFPASWADLPVLSALAGGGGYYAEWVPRDKLVYLVTMGVSGAAVAGIGGWLLVRSLARMGAVNPFPVAQELRDSRAV
jgi:energy-coupling factor transport system permease protein